MMKTSKKAKVRERLLGHCGYCGLKGNITVDHIKPRKLDGDNNPGNLIPSCRVCNEFKGSLKLKQFRHYLLQKKRWNSFWPRRDLTSLEARFSEFTGKFFYQQHDKVISLRNYRHYTNKAEAELLSMVDC